jgi:hypothetical protein
MYKKSSIHIYNKPERAEEGIKLIKTNCPSFRSNGQAGRLDCMSNGQKDIKN